MSWKGAKAVSAVDSGKTLVFQFGVFEVDPEAGELRKLGLRVKLQQQPYQVLLKLLEKPGGVVTRQELQQSLWGSDTFVDFDHGLNRLVNRLREALGDSADNPRYVETLPGKGYRFIAPVRPVEAEETHLPRPIPAEAGRPPSEQAPPQAPLEAGKASRTKAIAGTVAVIVLLMAGYLAFSRFPSSQPRVLRTVRITSDNRMKTTSSPGFYLSRPLVTDGARIYFMETTPGGRSLAQASVTGGDAVLLPTSFRHPAPADISPGGSDLLVVESTLGSELESPLMLLRLADGSVRRVGNLECHDATWSPNGSDITYASGHALYQARQDGSQARKLVEVAGDAWWPRWSPDGKRLRFTLIDPKTDSTALWEVSADGTGLHPLLPDWNNPPSECCGAWTGDGDAYVFQSTRDGQTNIWVIKGTTSRFSRSGPTPMQLTAGPTDSLAPLPSRDGKKLFVVGVMPRAELSRYDATSRQFVPYLSGISAEGVDFSRDGDWVTYVGYPDATLWRSKVDGSERMQLTVAPMRAFLPRWSPDRTRIAFAAASPGEPWRIYSVSAEGGDLQQLTTGECNEADVGWSEDGSRVVFGCMGGYGPTTSIRLLDLKTRQVSTVPGSEGLFSPRWSPDGRYLTAISEDSTKLMLFDFAGRKWTELAKAAVGYPSWSHDSRYVYFDSDSENVAAIYRVRVSDRRLEVVTRLGGFRRAWGAFGPWSGLAPDDSPLAFRDVGTQEVYALDWKAP